MIVFASILPHSPLLLPSIGKEHQLKLKKTLAAYVTLEEELYAAKPNTLVIFSPHGSVLPDTFALFISAVYRANLKEFGDLTTTLAIKGAAQLIEQLRRLRLEDPPVPLLGITDEFLDYGTVVPWVMLTKHLPAVRVVPLGISHLPLSTHRDVGARLGDILKRSSSRIAIIASADLAQTLTDNAPGGFSPEGKKFDEAIVQALRKDDRKKLMQLEAKAVAAKACGLRPIAMLLGALHETNYTPKILSYEGPFGVGYLTVNFTLH